MSVDTLSLAKELRAAELSSTQAEAIASAIGRAILEGAATKADLIQVRTELEAKIDTKIEQLRTTMMTWFIGTTMTLAALIVAVVKL